jgi:hypothetical protein
MPEKKKWRENIRNHVVLRQENRAGKTENPGLEQKKKIIEKSSG